MMDGDTSQITFPVPAAPTLPGTVPAAGIFVRISAIVNKIKASSSYTVQDGEDLGIEGAEQTQALPGEIKPAISLRHATATDIEIVWKKLGHAAIEIQVSLDAGATWTFLAIDTSPNYTDTTPVPATDAAQKRSYRAIYHDGEGCTGQWSDVVSIAVG